MARARSGFASFLAVLAALAVAMGVVGFWANRTIGDPATFSSLAGDLLREESVVTRLAVVIVDPVLANAPPELEGQRPIIVATTTRVLSDPRFVSVFEAVLRRVHRAVLDGDGDVRLQLGSALEAVTVEVRKVSPEVADQLEEVDPPEPVILAASRADRVRSLIVFERAASFALLIGGLILLAIAVIGGGPRALAPFGVALAVAGVGWILLIFGLDALVGIEVSAASREAATSAFDVVLDGLRTTLIVTAVIGVVLAIAGVATTRRS